jgi:hypothetical protein
VSAVATTEPLEVDVDADQLQRARASLPDGDQSPGTPGGGSGDRLPPLPPVDHDDRGFGRLPPRPPRWQRLLLWTVVLLLAFLTGAAIGQLGIIIERGHERRT